MKSMLLGLDDGNQPLMIIEYRDNYFMFLAGLLGSDRDNFIRITKTAYQELWNNPDNNVSNVFEDEREGWQEYFKQLIDNNYTNEL